MGKQKNREGKDVVYCCAASTGCNTPKNSAVITAFVAKLFVAHHEKLEKFFMQKGVSQDDATDMVAGMFANVVYKKIPKFQCSLPMCLGNPENCDGTAVRAWLYGIARNKALQYWQIPEHVDFGECEKIFAHSAVQDMIRDRASSLHESAELPDGLRNGLDQLMQKALQTLTKKQRQVILLMYFQGVETSTEVAEILESTPQAVRKLKSKAIKKLRELPELQAILRKCE